MTDSAPPIICRYEAGVFKPSRSSAQLRAAKFYREGEEYELVEHHQRSMRSHNHFFAVISEAFQNLPEVYAQEFSNADELRKWCLIRTGFCHRQEMVCGSAEEAQRLAAFIRDGEDYSIVQIDGAVIRRFTAKSTKQSAMDATEFQRAKTAVLDLLATIIGTTRGELESNTGKAA